MHLASQLCTGAQTGEGANQCGFAHLCAQLFPVDMGEGVNHRTCANHGVADVAVSANLCACANFYVAAKDAAQVNFYVLSAYQRGALAVGVVA